MAWEREALLLALIEGDETALDTMASVCGYKIEATKKSGAKLTGYGIRAVDQQIESLKSKRPPARFLRVVTRSDNPDTVLEKPAHLDKPNLILKPEPGTYKFDAPDELIPFSRLAPLLLKSLGQQRQGSRINTRKLTALIAKGEALTKIPRIPAQRWPQRLQIIVDTCAALRCYRSDFSAIAKALTRLLGESAVEVIRFDEDTLESKHPECINWPQQKNSGWRYWIPPAADTSILLLTDAGVLDSSHRGRVVWKRFTQKLIAHPAPLLVLSPAFESPTNSRWTRAFRPTALNDKSIIVRNAATCGFRREQSIEDSLEEALTALSALPLVDIGLLRKLRRAFSWGNSELEGLICNHTKIINDTLGMYLSPVFADKYRERYQQSWKGTKRAGELWKIVQEHHKGAYQGLRKLEDLYQATLEDRVIPNLEEYYKGLLASSNKDYNSEGRESILKQCQSVLNFAPKSIWQGKYSGIAHQLYGVVNADAIRTGQWPEQLPMGFNMGHYLYATSEKRIEKWWAIQCGSEGQVRFNKATANDEIPANAIVLDLHNNVPPTLSLQDSSSDELIVFHGQVVQLLDGERMTVNTALQHVSVEAVKKPGWASGIGTNASGLWATLPTGRKYKLVPWQVGVDGREGEWRLNENQDQYGLYTDLTLFNTNQRFRWIKPGTYLMGSLETEPERGNNETQHSVTLSQGYWMADTAVTQELWSAVMQENPSSFKDNLQNPVDSVSWDDAMKFIERLNQQNPGFNARLPSEAEWEYACRAGTETPFSFGDTISSEQINFSGNFPYNDGAESQYRGRTVPVKSLPANPWGLYEMHGNLWEWCKDWSADSSGEAQFDPTGPEKGAFRVLRGGSWIDYGRDVRSAYRYGYTADSRSNTGFRLVQGPGALVSGATVSQGLEQQHEQTRRDEAAERATVSNNEEQ